MTKTEKQVIKFIKECKKYRYWLKLNRWIDNYDIVTCIRVSLISNENTKLFNEMMVNLEVSIDDITNNLGRSMPWKSFKILLKPLIKLSNYEK